MVVRIAQASLAAHFDELFATVALGRNAPHLALNARRFAASDRLEALRAIHERHRSPRFASEPAVFFGAAGEPEQFETRSVRALADGEVVDLKWLSGYSPLAHEIEVRARYLASPANRVAHARLFVHREPRPTAILVHGYLGGRYALEERAWPLRWMFDRLGLDLALAVLPFHGLRNDGGRPLFPMADPRINVEGFRQAIFDLMSLRQWLEARGAPAVGVLGMSLGGYTTSLWATVDPRLAFAVPMIPLASIADFARDGGRLEGTPDEQLEQHRALEEAHRPVSPFTRPSLVAPDCVRILAAASDRITPTSHARRLASHFGAPITTFHGGHLLQFGRADGFREVGRMLGAAGLLAAREAQAA